MHIDFNYYDSSTKAALGNISTIKSMQFAIYENMVTSYNLFVFLSRPILLIYLAANSKIALPIVYYLINREIVM